MSNVLGNYNVTFFANEALIQLYKALGMAGRVHRGAEAERNGAGNSIGDTINMRRPSHFTAQAHVAGTGTTAQDLLGQNVSISLDQHNEVKFKITDKELAYTSERIVNEHIKPAAYALADKIDQDMYTLGAKVGPKKIISGTASSAFITGPRKVLRGNNVPMDPNMIHYAIDTGMEAAFLDMEIFHRADAVGGTANQEALMRGSLGQRFGVETFVSQNADVAGPTMASTVTASAGSGDKVFAVNNASGYAGNSTSMALDGGTGTETVSVGDTFTIAGDDTVYILTAAGTVATGALTVSFYPGLRKAVADNAVVTFDALDAVEEAANYRNIMFHRNAFALAFAPLPRTGDGRGAEIETVVDEVSGVALRARMFYDGATATNYVALDALYGIQVLDPMMAVRVKRATSVYPA